MKTSNNAEDQPKRTLLTGFGSFDCVGEDYIPKYHDALYCYKHIDKEFLSKGFLPRCPLLEKVFNDTATSFDDIYYPPKFTKPPQPKSHSEYKVSAISQLISVLNWWARENVNDPKLLCFYAYSYGPCKLRTIIAVGGNTLDNLITEFNYSHPAIAAELKELASNLVKKATDWDAQARLVQQSQCWIDPKLLNPVQVKEAAAALLHKLRHIGSLVREQTTGSPQQADLAKQPPETGQESRATRGNKATTKNKVDECTYGPGFRSVLWFGTKYAFTSYQAACVKILWEAWENKTPDVGDATLLAESGSESKRLKDVFKDRPAWGTMIVSGETKGTHRLAKPAKKRKKAKKPAKAE